MSLFKSFFGRSDNSSEENETSCVFCQIAHGKQPTTILYQDDEFVVFPDLRPAATHHYLVIPKNHVRDVKVLTAQDVSLVERMVEIGRKILQEKSADMTKTRFGFHWPPFCSIKHLHLHVISPSDAILTKYNIIGMFSPGTPWFATADYVINHLKNQKAKETSD